MKESHGTSVLEQVLILCEDNLKTRVLEENIENCFWLGRKKNEQHSVLFTVNSHNLKMKLLRNRKLLKGAGITLTEDMSPARCNLYQKAVQKWGKQKTGFYNGEIWVKLRENKLQILDLYMTDIDTALNILEDYNNITTISCSNFDELNSVLFERSDKLNFTILHYNIKSLQAHYDELCMNILSETWNISNINSYKINVFQIYYNEAKYNKCDERCFHKNDRCSDGIEL
ncbi:unnamed protein product [Acanthoscelides obtectus]|uniref:Uncharacterized protein n=1 Tax=Acanthoscelides obtectus TaxID=200917 RepID=A0A9P0PEZ8_ACAOB|nr:unnamed protein product [Acanthoscelides obtectus]CAK1631873.1 hypothetical protein AOBTE_LOCUS7217 [Acanthoscelides obtectus]